MTAKLEKLEGLKRQLAVTVPAEDLQSAYQKRVNEFAKQAKIKGFRPGKVPLNVVEQKFGKGILQEAAAELIQSHLDEQFKEHNLNIAGRPDVDFDHENLKKGESFEFTANFEVYPEIALKELEGVEVESLEGEVTEEDVSAMLIKLRTQHAEWKDADNDHEAKLGDRIQIDFDGTMDGEPLDKGSAKDAWLELGSKSMIPGFEDGLIGVKSGDEKKLSLSFPEDYHVEELKGKPVEFDVKVTKVQSPKLPELNDAFAEKMGVKEGADALKEKIKENLQNEMSQTAQGLLKQTVLDKLIELNPIDVPSALIDMEVKNLQAMTRQQMRHYLKDMSDADIEKMPLTAEPYLEEAKKRVSLGLLLSELIKTREIKVNNEQVMKKVTEIAAAYPNAKEVVEMYSKNKRMLSEIEAFVLEEQAVTALLEKAKVNNVKKSYDAIMQSGREQG